MCVKLLCHVCEVVCVVSDISIRTYKHTGCVDGPNVTVYVLFSVYTIKNAGALYNYIIILIVQNSTIILSILNTTDHTCTSINHYIVYLIILLYISTATDTILYCGILNYSVPRNSILYNYYSVDNSSSVVTTTTLLSTMPSSSKTPTV